MKINGTAARRSDWTLLLEVYIDRHRTTPFAWGAHDCVSFAAQWVELAREDLSPLADLGLTHASAWEAVRAMAGRSLLEAVNDWGQLTPIAPSFARRGDIALVDCEDRQCLSVCVGEAAAAPGVTGLVLVPMTAARAAWRV
jgi:hypothetical protein